MDKARIEVWENDQTCEKMCKIYIDDCQKRKEDRLISMTLPKVIVHNTCAYQDRSVNFKEKVIHQMWKPTLLTIPKSDSARRKIESSNANCGDT